MDHLGHKFAGRITAADGDAAKFEMCPAREVHLHFDAGVILPGIGDEERGARAVAQRHAEAVQFGRIAADDQAAHHALARAHVDRLPLIERVRAQPRQPVHIGIAPRLIAASGEGRYRHAITAS